VLHKLSTKQYTNVVPSSQKGGLTASLKKGGRDDRLVRLPQYSPPMESTEP